jgi:hypothetical protein
LVSQQAREQIELLLEELLVVAEVESEERERLRQRTATDNELRAAVRDGVEGGELGVHPNGILRTQHGHGCAEPDAFGSASDRRQDHVRCGVHHVAAVVLGDVERVDPDSIGENRSSTVLRITTSAGFLMKTQTMGTDDQSGLGWSSLCPRWLASGRGDS